MKMSEIMDLPSVIEVRICDSMILASFSFLLLHTAVMDPFLSVT